MTTISKTFEDGLLVLTLDEPERRNPIGHDVRRMLAALLSEAESDSSVKAVVLNGAGGHFSAGGDIREQNAVHHIIEARDRFLVIKDLVGRMVRFPKPLVAAVEGWAAGGGFSLAMACETVVASRTARFTSSFGKIGVIPDMGLLATLPARIGIARARRIVLDCATIDGEEGYRIGMIDERVDAGEALARASALARTFMLQAPLPRALIKDFLSAELDRALDFERQIQPILLFSADAAEGRAAFFEKRQPNFRGA